MKKNKLADSVAKYAWWLSRNIATARRTDGKFLMKQERRLQKRLAKIWKKQLKWVLENSRELSFFPANENSISTNAIEGEINEFVRKIPEQDELAETVVAAMRFSLFKGMKTIIRTQELGKFGIAFDLKNPEAIKFLGGKLSHELSQYRGNIHATTTNKISKILKKAADTGQSYSETAQLIREQTDRGIFSQARGELVSTREVGVAYEKGNEIPIKEFNLKNPDRLVLKFWQTVGDDRVTEKCKKNQERGWIDRREKFPSGDETAPRNDHPRCRCNTLYKITKPS